MTAENAIDLSRCATDRIALCRIGLVVGAAALLFGILGPFGTHVLMAFGARLAYWLVTAAAIGGPIALTLWALRRHVFTGRLPWWVSGLVAVLAVLPGLLVVEAALAFWAPHAAQYVTVPELAVQILILNLLGVGAENLLRTLLANRPEAEAAGPAAPTAATVPFADRLPPHLAGARLLALQAEDHYLRIHTAAGEALIHMRLSEAVARLGAVDGLQVHRSHWVARAALAGTERREGRLFLRLEGGLLVPVSRSFRARLAAANWLTAPHEHVKKF